MPMSQTRKSAMYAQLKASGMPLSRQYREYTESQLEEELTAAGIRPVEEPQQGVLESHEAAQEEAPPAGFFGYEEPAPAPAPVPAAPTPPPVASQADPDELPGQRLNTSTLDDVIRIDEQGRKWHQEEVKKPAYPKPRGRRVLKYMETGVRKETVQQGEYIETFEVAGNETSRPAEVKITLPSYQVGIYTDPRFPFKIHCYDGRQGFDLQEVQAYYGGSEMVPASVKRIYIENDLCYEIRSVIRTIQAEHRQLQLTGRIK